MGLRLSEKEPVALFCKRIIQKIYRTKKAEDSAPPTNLDAATLLLNCPPWPPVKLHEYNIWKVEQLWQKGLIDAQHYDEVISHFAPDFRDDGDPRLMSLWEKINQFTVLDTPRLEAIPKCNASVSKRKQRGIGVVVQVHHPLQARHIHILDQLYPITKLADKNKTQLLLSNFIEAAVKTTRHVNW